MHGSIFNILRNLTDFEQKYLAEHTPELNYEAFDTYKTYLDSYFINPNNLSKVYWPQCNLPLPKSIRNLPILDEQILMLSGYDIALSKHINFPADIIHASNYYNCVFMLSGNATLKWNDCVFQLSQDDFFIVAPHAQYYLDCTGSSIAVNIMIRNRYISDHYITLTKSNPTASAFFYETTHDSIGKLFLFYHSKDDSPISDYVLNMFTEYLWGDKYSPDVLSYYLQLIFIQLFRHMESTVESNVRISTMEKNFENIISYLKTNFRTASLSSTAENIHFSKQYICKIMKKCTGNTFSDYLNSLRIDTAKIYLKETSLRLESIAELCGFSDAAYFSRLFKEREGISPSKYRTIRQRR